jgi:hypothetical protein
MLPNICDIQPNKISSNMKSKIFWFHGEPGTWKTTVASKFPKAFIAGFEIGYQFIDGVYALPMGGWSDMKDLYRQLKMQQVKDKFDTIIFDTISGGAAMCYKYALGQLGINDPSEAAWGQGWRKIKDEWKIIQDIAKLGYCIVFISHSKETEVTDAKTKQTSIKVKTDMEGWSGDSVWGLCDFAFYSRKELEEDGELQNVYAYCDVPNLDTTTRPPAFPLRILFSYHNIVKGLDGTTDAGVTENIREIEEEGFESVRDGVIELVKKLSATAANAEMTRYITEMFPETRLSETGEIHKDKLIAARDYLIALAEKVNG